MKTDRLNDKQIQILQLTAEGLERVEIAARLELSDHTIRNHKTKIFRVLKAKSSAHAVAIALARQLIKPVEI